jgi:hypothetical protein
MQENSWQAEVFQAIVEVRAPVENNGSRDGFLSGIGQRVRKQSRG